MVPTLNLLGAKKQWLPGREVTRQLVGSQEPLACTLSSDGGCASHGRGPQSRWPPCLATGRM